MQSPTLRMNGVGSWRPSATPRLGTPRPGFNRAGFFVVPIWFFPHWDEPRGTTGRLIANAVHRPSKVLQPACSAASGTHIGSSMRQRYHHSRPDNCNCNTHAGPRRDSNPCKHTRYANAYIFSKSNTRLRTTPYTNSNYLSHPCSVTCANPRSVSRPNTCTHPRADAHTCPAFPPHYHRQQRERHHLRCPARAHHRLRWRRRRNPLRLGRAGPHRRHPRLRRLSPRNRRHP